MSLSRFLTLAVAATLMASPVNAHNIGAHHKSRNIDRVGFSQNVLSRISPEEDMAYRKPPTPPAPQPAPYAAPMAEAPAPMPAPAPMVEPSYAPMPLTPAYAEQPMDAPSMASSPYQQAPYPDRANPPAIARSTLYTGMHAPTIEKLDQTAEKVFRYSERLSGGPGAVDIVENSTYPRTRANVRRFPTQSYSPANK